MLLLCIAFLPLIHKTEEWWEHNKNRLLVAVSLGLVTLLYYTFIYGHGVIDHGTHELSAPGFPAAIVVLKNAILVEYIPFIALLFSLYVISGGIAFNGNLVGRPRLNTAIIAIGAAISSFIGTTGAAMLLIRPLLKANAKRDYVAHTVIFFIFVVCWRFISSMTRYVIKRKTGKRSKHHPNPLSLSHFEVVLTFSGCSW